MGAPKTQIRRDTRLFAQACEAVLERGHSAEFSAQGQSMQPNLLDEDVVVVAPAKAGE